ncbi:hypothetical protein F4806DRAFT_504118 [Annulohypoxylon nitens]|nr:hypothetical protein F4806DRAFT_504118 [Annulohypoxylon nitens]
MTLTTFHLFPQLPLEIQMLIWEAAIRPVAPSAHFFSVWNIEYNESYKNFPKLIDGSAVWQKPKFPGITRGLVPPRFDGIGPGIPSWFDDNPSGYAIDSGIWTACRESRKAMLRRFGKKITAPPAEGQSLETVDEYATGIVSENGQKRRITVNPKADLICLQQFNKYTTMPWVALASDVPILKMTRSPEYNIAFEFDHTWIPNMPLIQQSMRISLFADQRRNHQLFNPNASTIDSIFLASSLLWAKNLWFIDYRISPDPKAEPLDYNDGRLVVFQGNGCKFVEVRNEDRSRWDMGHETSEYAISSFFAKLDEAIRWYRDPAGWLLRRLSPNQFVDQTEPEVLPKLGILARVMDS